MSQGPPAVRCYVFDLDDVLLPTTQLFQQPHVRQRLAHIQSHPETIIQAYQSFIHPDMHLIHLLHQSTACPKYLITNASRGHARASLDALCITRYFQGQLDATCNMRLKPHSQMFRAMHNHIINQYSNRRLQIFFFDDRIENLIEPRLLNWNTVWIFGTTRHQYNNNNQQSLPSFVNYAFPTIHAALQFFNTHNR